MPHADESEPLDWLRASSTAGDRGSPAASLVRVRRIAGCDVGVMIRDQDADLVLAFDQRGDRDRLAAKLR